MWVGIHVLSSERVNGRQSRRRDDLLINGVMIFGVEFFKLSSAFFLVFVDSLEIDRSLRSFIFRQRENECGKVVILNTQEIASLFCSLDAYSKLVWMVSNFV